MVRSIIIFVMCAMGCMLAACDSSDRGASCEEMRQFGDYKQASDVCWDPPGHYCSQGAGGAETLACSPDVDKCCHMPSTCIPCGWTVCTYVCKLYEEEICVASDPSCPESSEFEHLAADQDTYEECRVSYEPICYR